MEFVPGGSISSIINRFGPLKKKKKRTYPKYQVWHIRGIHIDHFVFNLSSLLQKLIM